MKKVLFLLLSASIIFSCSNSGKKADAADSDGDKKNNGNVVCTIKGRYSSAPDGTVLYMTSVDDVNMLVDSAVVRGGQFTFLRPDTTMAVRFISSQMVIDGGYVVVEPGVVNVDFTGNVFVGGTPSNERLNRFMEEREKIINLRKFCEPASLDMFGVDVAMRDSLNDVLTIANDIFDAYSLKEIKENIENPLGYFYLVQSVGVSSPAKLLPQFDKVPVKYRDKLYAGMKKRVEDHVNDAAMAEKFLEEMARNIQVTAVGKRFQNFELNNIKGGKVLLSAEVFSNKYTLVLFWASWESGARDLLQVLSMHYGKHKEEGLQIVGVSLDSRVDDCKTLIEELGIDWIQLCNPSGGSAEVAAAYGITELPVAVLVNNRGTIIARMSTIDEVVRKIEELF